MATDHLSRRAVEAFVRSELPAGALAHVDRHLADCEPCRAMVAEFTSNGAGLLGAVQLERRRHLSFDEFESLVENAGSITIDTLAQHHLQRCEGCQRELADLRSFEARLQGRTVPAGPAAAAPGFAHARRRRGWFSRPVAWAATIAAVATVVALMTLGPGLLRQRDESAAASAAFVVRLDPADGAAATKSGSSSLQQPGEGVAAPAAAIEAIGRARRLAAQTGRAQTIEVRITSREYSALADELRSIGTLEATPAPGARAKAAAPDDRLVVSITLRPAGTAAAGVPRDRNAQ